MTREEESILNTDYDKKYEKRALEVINSLLMKGYGDVICLTGPAFKAHWDAYKKFLTKDSKFFVAEKEQGVCQDILAKAEEVGDKRISILNGDIFEGINYAVKKYNAVFKYIHLDFCITAKTLMRDHNLYGNLCNLAENKKALKKRFYLDVTFSLRPDPTLMYIKVMNELILEAFGYGGWRVTNLKRNNSSDFDFVREYREPQQNPMINALYQFDKVEKKSKGHKNAYGNEDEINKILNGIGE